MIALIFSTYKDLNFWSFWLKCPPIHGPKISVFSGVWPQYLQSIVSTHILARNDAYWALTDLDRTCHVVALCVCTNISIAENCGNFGLRGSSVPQLYIARKPHYQKTPLQTFYPSATTRSNWKHSAILLCNPWAVGGLYKGTFRHFVWENRRKYENGGNTSSEMVHRTKNLPKVSNALVFLLISIALQCVTWVVASHMTVPI